MIIPDFKVYSMKTTAFCVYFLCVDLNPTTRPTRSVGKAYRLTYSVTKHKHPICSEL